MTTRLIRNTALLLIALALSACATVQPWQRADLARPGMAFDSDPLLTGYRDHVAVSKEAASGGVTLGGGGCGCN